MDLWARAQSFPILKAWLHGGVNAVALSSFTEFSG